MKNGDTKFTPDQLIARFELELDTIVKNRDLKALDVWKKRYIKMIGVTFAVPDIAPIGIDPVKQTQMKVIGHLGLTLGGAALWTETMDPLQINKVKQISAQVFFFDVLDKMGTPKPEGKPD